MAELEETLEKVQKSGTVLGKKKIWAMGYADDIAMLAESKQGIK